MTEVRSFPDGPTILLDRCQFGGFEVEPHMCPAASGRGSWFSTFTDAREYTEALAADVGATALILCADPKEGEA